MGQDIDPLNEESTNYAATLASFLEEAKKGPSDAIERWLGDHDVMGHFAGIVVTNQAQWNQFEIKLRNAAKARVGDINKLASAAKARSKPRHLKVVQPGDTDPFAPVPVVGSIPDAPVSPEAIVPSGYQVSLGGIYNQKMAKIAAGPILITDRLKDLNTEEEDLRLAWHRDGHWQKHILPRKLVAQRTKAVELAAHGAPIDSENGKDVVTFLREYEAANISAIPVQLVSSRLGWLGETGEHGFLLGHDYFPMHGSASVVFRGLSEGSDSLIEGYQTCGSLEDWKAGVELLNPFPKALLPFYATFVAPLLNIFQCPNFAVHCAARTSTGKSSVLRAAASVWGSPNEGNSTMHTWNVTTVFVERMATVLFGLPIILDDTAKAKTEKAISDNLYLLESGQGRGRGTKADIAGTKAFRTVLISSGEAAISGHTNAGGANARVLSIWGSPFKSDDEVTGAIVNGLNAAVRQNYGHAGKQFIEWLIANKVRWPEFRNRYEGTRDALTKKIVGGIGGRLAAYGAAVSVAGRLAHEALGLGGEYIDPVEELWGELVAEAGNVSADKRALRDLISWCSANRERFHGKRREGSPSNGWLGLWDQEQLAVYPTELATFLKQHEYNYDAIIRAWNDRGWLGTDKDRNDKKVTVEGNRTRMICIKLDVFENEGEPGESSPQAGHKQDTQPKQSVTQPHPVLPPSKEHQDLLNDLNPPGALGR